MPVQTVTIDLPASVYERLQRRARQANRSLEAELRAVVTAAVPAPENLPEDLAKAVEALDLLSDRELWQAAESRLDPEAVEHLEALHLKRQDEGLTEEELSVEQLLIRRYERNLLVRAKAAAVLRARGHDVSTLLQPA